MPLVSVLHFTVCKELSCRFNTAPTLPPPHTHSKVEAWEAGTQFNSGGWVRYLGAETQVDFEEWGKVSERVT